MKLLKHIILITFLLFSVNAEAINDNPIIMLHGMFGSGSIWSTMRGWLVADGYDTSKIYTPNLANSGLFDMCNDSNEDQLEGLIATAMSEHSASEVVVIGYSMGGRISFQSMHVPIANSQYVEIVINIAGSSQWDCGINLEPDQTIQDAYYTSIWSPADTQNNEAMRVIDGAHNVEVAGVTHLQFPTSALVYDQVIIALDGGGYNDGVPAPSNPTISAINIATTGTTLTITYDMAVTQGTNYVDTDLDVDASTGGNNISLVYSSGNGTTSHVYAISTTIRQGETVNFDFNGDRAIDCLENATGDDLATVVDEAVINNSTYTPPPPIVGINLK